VNGSVKVHDDDDDDDDDNNVIIILNNRVIFGELAAIFSETRNATITAVNETQLMQITLDVLYEIMLDQREVAKELIRFLAERIQFMMK
jgi:CRP-like cAMP-binding protein